MQLAVDTAFLEVAVQFIGPTSNGLSAKQAEALERISFDWILNPEQWVGSSHTELFKARDQVTQLWVEVLRLIPSASGPSCPLHPCFYWMLYLKQSVDSSNRELLTAFLPGE